MGLKTKRRIKLRVVGNQAWCEGNIEYEVADSVDRDQIREGQVNYFEYIKTDGPRKIVEMKNGMIWRK